MYGFFYLKNEKCSFLRNAEWISFFFNLFQAWNEEWNYYLFLIQWTWTWTNFIFKRHFPNTDQCLFVLAFLYLYLLEFSFKSRVSPERWELSYVSPISKSGDKSLVTNWRPVSIISIILNIFESIILYNKINPSFKTIIIDEKHVFMSGRSTTTNLLKLQQYEYSWTHFLCVMGCQVHDINENFSKVFDKIVYNIHTNLYDVGFCNPFYLWLVSFCRVEHKNMFNLKVWILTI